MHIGYITVQQINFLYFGMTNSIHYMKPGFCCLLLLLGALCAHGQMLDLWYRVMASKGLSPFKQFAGQPGRRVGKDGLDTVYYRTLYGDYKEGIFTYDHYLSTAPEGKYPYEEYQLWVITWKGKMIEGKLMQVVNGSDEQPDSIRFLQRGAYRDVADYVQLQQGFKQTTGASMDTTQLFRDGIVFGYQCGVGGAVPDERFVTDSLLKYRNRVGLLSWLQATNTEKQLYGYDAFVQLKRSGLRLNDEERKLMRMISRKRGSVNTCAWCSFGAEEISMVIRRIKRGVPYIGNVDVE